MVKPIRDEKSYNEALKRIELLWGSEIGTPEGDELDVLMILVEAYEDKHYPMPPSDPVAAASTPAGGSLPSSISMILSQ